MTIKELLENYNELNENVENKFKPIIKKIKNKAIAAMLGASLLFSLSGCSQAQKDVVYKAYDDTKKEAERAYNNSKEFLGDTYKSAKEGILKGIDELDVPGKISKLGDKINNADVATGDWIKDKYGDKFEKEMKELPAAQQAIIKAKLLAYAGVLELTQYDSFETKKAIMFINYWKKLIKQAKDKQLKEDII